MFSSIFSRGQAASQPPLLKLSKPGAVRLKNGVYWILKAEGSELMKRWRRAEPNDLLAGYAGDRELVEAIFQLRDLVNSQRLIAIAGPVEFSFRTVEGVTRYLSLAELHLQFAVGSSVEKLKLAWRVVKAENKIPALA